STLPNEKLYAWEMMDKNGGVPCTRKMLSWNLHNHAEELDFKVSNHSIGVITLKNELGKKYKAVDPNHLIDEQ
ncbi:hypothetical protein KI387_041013, partial [Taxus chinensis]